MERGRWTYAAAMGVALLSGVPLTVAFAAEPVTSDIELRVLTYGAIAPADIDLARQTVTELLATGGVRIDWRTCAGESCKGPSESPRVILVYLLPITKRDAPETSGEVARELGTNKPSVLVYVPRNVELIHEIRRRAGRLHPGLSSLALGHLVGLTIAHEIGHSLGLGHSSTGPMKPRPGPEDIIAMKEGRLRFPAVIDPVRSDTLR